MHDILICGGMLFDGSGRPGVPGDILIADGRIAAIGQNLERRARKTIDADGLAVAPGFIDIKTHSDFTLPINPKAESKVRQGVTTEIIGHCGFSVAPALPGKVDLLKDYLSPSAHAGWAQHAAPDGDGHGEPPSERRRDGGDERAPGGRLAGGRARDVIRPVHAARLICAAG
jgi:hypothetical protein